MGDGAGLVVVGGLVVGGVVRVRDGDGGTVVGRTVTGGFVGAVVRVGLGVGVAGAVVGVPVELTDGSAVGLTGSEPSAAPGLV